MEIVEDDRNLCDCISNLQLVIVGIQVPQCLEAGARTHC